MSHEVRGNCGVKIGNGLALFLLSHREGGAINENFFLFQSNGQGLSGNEAVCQVRANQGPRRRTGPSIDWRATCVWLRCALFTLHAHGSCHWCFIGRIEGGLKCRPASVKSGQVKLRRRGRARHGLLATPPLANSLIKMSFIWLSVGVPRQTHSHIPDRCLQAAQQHHIHLLYKKKVFYCRLSLLLLRDSGAAAPHPKNKASWKNVLSTGFTVKHKKCWVLT